MKGQIELVAMRLADMRRVHPQQDNTRFCGLCGERLGIYPTGQRVLRMNPKAKLVCAHCAIKREYDLTGAAALSPEEFIDEQRQSVDVGKA